jgi:hypothetical protein
LGRREDIVEDINLLLQLRAMLTSIESVPLNFKVLNIKDESFDRLSRQQVLTSLNSLFVELGRYDFEKQLGITNG